ncbi:MAG: hypothetical protein HY979_01980 [Candidatus Magasanikbacteria bacterium]|nr:hypothetical protein [Candidatus Magasanikbacteria bacterium]
MNSQKWWLWSLFGGFGIGWAFLGGYAQFNIYAIFLLCLYAIIQFLYIDKRAMTPEEIARFFMPLVSMIIIGGIISLPQILPALKFTPLTIRAGGLDYSATTLKVVEPGDFSLFLFPDYLYFPYLSSGRKSLYIGAFWFFLSVAVFFIGLDKIRKKDINHKLKILIALFSLFIFSLIASLKWSPIFYLMNKLPVFEYFRFPYRWMYLGIWFLSVIGALGFDFIKDYSNDAYLRRVFRIIGILIGAIFTSVIFLNFGGNIFWDNAVRLIDFIFSLVLYGKFGLDKNPAHYLDAIKRGISAWQEFLSLYEISFLVPFSVLVSGFLLISAFIWNKLAWYKFRILGMFLSLATFLFIFAGQWSNSVDGGKIFNYRNMLEKFINPDNLLLYRTYPFMLDYGFSKIVPPKYAISKNELSALTDLQFTSGWPNMGFYSGIQSVDGYEPFTTKDLFSALGKIGSTHGGEEYTKKLSVDKKIARFLSSLEVIGMMSGKYVISGVELSHERLRLIGKEYVTEYKIPLFLYENNLAMPKFYFAKKTVLSPGKSLADLVDMANRDFGNNTYLDCSDCNLDSSIGDFEVLSYKNGQIKIRTSTNALGWFIFSESFLPGWIALIDGLPVTIMRVNGLYMGINIPTGQHDLEFSYNGILGEGKFLKYLRITN